MMNRKAFELSINMLVVIILGLVLMGVGILMFSQAYGKVSKIQEDVNSQSEQQLQQLLLKDVLAVPFATKDVKRGENAVFNVGLKNELGVAKNFKVLVAYRGSSAYDSIDDPFRPMQNNYYLEDLQDNDACSVSGEIPLAAENCGQEWVLMSSQDEAFMLENNKQVYFPINIQVPKNGMDILGNDVGLKKGQYIFNLYVCTTNTSTSAAACEFDESPPPKIINQYASTKQLILNIK